MISFQELVGHLDKRTVANLVGNTKDLWTPISRMLEFFCICVEF